MSDQVTFESDGCEAHSMPPRSPGMSSKNGSLNFWILSTSGSAPRHLDRMRVKILKISCFGMTQGGWMHLTESGGVICSPFV